MYTVYIWFWPTLRMTVHGFWPTVYIHIRRMYGLNCEWTVFAGGAVRFPATAILFALFGQFSFLAPFLTELFLCFPFL